MNTIRRFLSRHGLYLGVGTAITLVLGSVYTFGVGSFLPGMSSTELQNIQSSSSGKTILQNPLWLPLRFLDWVFIHLKLSGGMFRLSSALLAVLIVFSFYYLCSKWYSTRITVLICCLFILSSTTLLLARTGTPAILLYSFMAVSALVAWFRYSHLKRFTPFVFLLLMSLALYIPGMIWFMGLLAIWFWRDIPHFFKHMDKRAIIIGGSLASILVVPLFYAFFKNTSSIYDWLVLPRSYDLGASLSTLKQIPAAFFYRTNLPPAYNLGKLPIFDALSGTMFLLGLYAYRTKLQLQRTIVFIVAALVSITLTTLNNNQLYLLYMLPFTYFIIAEGLTLVLGEWRTVFPRNPLARFIGTFLLSLAVLSACSYHLNRYFLAWHNAPDTKAIYNIDYKKARTN